MLRKILSIALTTALLLFSFNASAQTVSINGTVVDEQGIPVIGAAVIQQSTTNGVATDLDGAFKLSVPKGSTVLVSFIGYVTKSFVVEDQTVYNIILAEDTQLLEETVVIGYGVQKKSDLTGAVTSVKDSDLSNRSTISPVQALQGKAAGVQIVNASGAPGASSSIQIRGYSSNSSTEPLMIVDGLKVSDINYLDPDNIASIEILKDAASAAIYGIEAGNGVILVTTKSGKDAGSTKGRVFYNFMSSTQSISNLPDLMDAKTYVAYQDLMGNNSGVFWDGVTDTYWPDYIFENGQASRHTVGAQASDKNGSIYVSVSYVDDNGIVAGDKDVMKRLSGQINAEYKVTDWLTIGTNNSIEHSKTRSISERNSINASTLGSTMVFDPIVPYTYDMNNLPQFIANKYNDPSFNLPKDKDGNIYGISQQGDGSLIYHPAVMRDRSDSESESFNLRGSTYANFTPFKGFLFTSRLGYRAGNSSSSTYNYPFRMSAVSVQDMSLTGTNSSDLFYQWENFANYNLSVDKSDFTAMAGFSFQMTTNNSTSGTAYVLTDTAPNYRYLSYAVNDARMTLTGQPSQRANMSYYGRLGWSYDRKYMIQANFRADAYDTSKLDPSNRWGYFPSLSAGWTVSNEEFMRGFKEATSLSFMKFRASWGINGNVNSMGNYQYSDVLAANNRNGYNFNDVDNRIVGVGPSGTLPNPRIQWETSRQVDLGLDLRFFKEKLALTIDWYNKNTNNLLTSTAAPANTGSSTTYINAGKINNRGTEFELSWKDTRGDFSYGISGNIATLHNEVLEGTQVGRVPGYQVHTAEPVTYFEPGFPLWYLRLYDVIGIDQQTGAPIYADLDNNSVINDNDRVAAGSGIPDFTYGLTVNMAWKGFDLTVYGSGAQGVTKLFSMTRADNTQLNTLKLFYDDAWHDASSTGYTHPKPSRTDSKILCSTDRIFDASFFKIKQIQLGYNVPKNFAQKLHLDALRIYASLDDWFTITKYPGLDPESSQDTGSGLGVDTGSFPISKKVVFGVNVSLF